MSVIELINHLTQQDIRVWLEHGQLRFSAPQGGMSESTRQLLKDNKAALIAFLEASGSNNLMTITSVNHEQAQVLSFSQERIWFLNQLHPHNCSLHLPIVFSIQGALNISLLEKTFTLLIERHAILRTAFRQTLAGTLQQQLPSYTVSIPQQHRNHPLQATDIQQIAEQEMQAIFQLDKGDVCHLLLVNTPENQHYLFVTLHHIASDAWSMGILAKELAHIYHSLCTGKTPQLEPLPIAYCDFAVWQKQQLASKQRELQLQFWRNALDECENLNLNADYPRTNKQENNGASLFFSINAGLTHELKTIAKEQHTTLYVTLASLLGILFYRYTQQPRFCIGTPTAGRPNSNCEGVIGCFINVLPIPFQHDKKDTFKHLLAKNHATTQAAMANQDVPFEEIVKAVVKHRDAHTTPLFQVLFGLQNTPVEAVNEINGLHIELLNVEKTAATYELNISAREWQDELQIEIEYRSQTFKKASIESLRDNFLTLVDSAIANPGISIDKLNILNPVDQHKQLSTWNNTCQQWPAFMPAYRLIEQQAEQNPHRIALRYQNRETSYYEMNKQANRLAHQLISAGISDQHIVAVMLERSEQLPVTLLAIQKTGACYLPLDQEQPVYRLQRILADAKPGLCISQHSLQHIFTDMRIKPLLIDDITPTQENEHNLDHCDNASQLFNIIYTSGSTGTPKGVMINHAAISNRLNWMQQTFPIGLHDRILQKTPFHFDVSVWEIFWPLMQGAELVIAEPGDHKNPDRIITLIKQHNITVIHFVPSMLAVFLESLPNDACTSLKRIFSSGETLTPSIVKTCHERLPHVQIENLYGPTEAAIDVSWHHCQAGEIQIPIGNPISNIQLYVVDEALQLLPVGSHGEIVIAGQGLALGYLNNPETTQEVFVRNPFTPDSLLYKTGDIGCLDHKGQLHFKGRRDQQIKIRGQRVELGEIESLLKQYPSIQSAHVSAKTGNTKNGSIIAYFIASEEIDSTQLRHYLQNFLPVFMLPNAFVQLENWPLLSNGKINRKLLPDPERNDLLSKNYTAPRDAVEQQIASVWKELLQLNDIGINDNFFELGGHSLLATIALTRLQNEFNVKIPLTAFFNEPTIANFATAIHEARQTQSDDSEEITL